MDKSEIERDIRKFITDEFFYGRADNLSGEGSLLGTAIDSTGILVLVTHLQEHFSITVEDSEVVPSNLDSVKNLTAYVERKMQSKSSSS
jgi:acyl carrier protein